MKIFNIVVVRPESVRSRIHVQCFQEVARYLSLALLDLGYEVVCDDRLREDCTNIVLAYHLLDGAKLPEKYDCIVYQLEELTDSCDTPIEYMLSTLSSNCRVWDYSESNIEFLREHGVDAVLKPIGFHPKMECIPSRREKDVDILFYGSGNERRLKILAQLQKEFKVKVLFGIYGQERDEWISRSRIVLSIYYYECKHFDDVRMAYLMNNRVFTILEDTPERRYNDFLVYAPYDQLVDACRYFLENDHLRKSLAYKAFSGFAQHPETDFLARALANQPKLAPVSG